MGEELQVTLDSWNTEPYDINSPYYQLWRGVLYLGIYDFRCAVEKLGKLPSLPEDYAEMEPQHLRQAIRWIRSVDMYPGSFHWVCAIVGYDAGAIRSRLFERYG